MRQQFHPHPRGAIRVAHVGHDLAGLQGAIAARQAGAILEKLQNGEIQVLVEGLARTDAFVLVGQPALDAARVDSDAQHIEIRSLPAPGMAADRIHGRGECQFVLGGERAVLQHGAIAPQA